MICENGDTQSSINACKKSSKMAASVGTCGFINVDGLDGKALSLFFLWGWGWG